MLVESLLQVCLSGRVLSLHLRHAGRHQSKLSGYVDPTSNLKDSSYLGAQKVRTAVFGHQEQVRRRASF